MTRFGVDDIDASEIRPSLGALLARDFSRCGRNRVIVKLPVGIADGPDAVIRDVWLEPITGNDEMWIDRVGSESSLPQWVSLVLNRCVTPIGTARKEGLAQELSVADRDMLILNMRMLTLGPDLWGTTGCPHEGCGARLDFTFHLPSLEAPVPRTGTGLGRSTIPRQCSDSTGEISFAYREPNGSDQEAIAAIIHGDPNKAFLRLLSRCLIQVDGVPVVSAETLNSLSREDLLAMDRRIAEETTSFDWEIKLTCPECSGLFSAFLDIHAFYWEELNLLKEDLWREVHEIAFFYHWPEENILSLPRWKRKLYLNYIHDEMGRSARPAIRGGYGNG
jgi:hypothetical protein